MTRGFWTCPACESENPGSASQCLTCSVSRDVHELAGATHRRHLVSALLDGRAWRIVALGPGYVVTAARFRTTAEAKGRQLLAPGAQADQTVVVSGSWRRGWLVYVRSALVPYPSTLRPRQRLAVVRPVIRAAVPGRDPIEGRIYIGRVGDWSDDKGYWPVDCADRRIGEVRMYPGDVGETEAVAVRPGQHVSFTIRKVAGALVAGDVAVLGAPPGA